MLAFNATTAGTYAVACWSDELVSIDRAARVSGIENHVLLWVVSMGAIPVGVLLTVGGLIGIGVLRSRAKRRLNQQFVPGQGPEGPPGVSAPGTGVAGQAPVAGSELPPPAPSAGPYGIAPQQVVYRPAPPPQDSH
ncbi:MAG: hypothetical protein Q4C85_07055 [Actinomyces sp.]|uniref:hypothetical protein n=1 Tax=Actinomyces sp. TaxID=29317 RepID=UPI0026DD4652|nr:hypothetical protein [Actinomyces sp.]MDO4243500.1 hypothetical protein [Actinomyces sp.]